MKKRYENIFVTVGTTAFDDLIIELTNLSNLKLLSKLGCRKLTLQIGRGEESYVNSCDTENLPIDVVYYRFKPSLKDDLQSSDLIIGHAGAGTCLESLELQKPLIVVINEKLHDNHQVELAQKLSEEKYLTYCTPKTLSSVLSDETLFEDLKIFRPGDPKLFTNWLDDYFGLSH